MPSFRKVKCRFAQGKGGGNYTSVSYLEFPSLPFPANVLLQTLSLLPPQPLPLGQLVHPQVQPSPPGCISFQLPPSWCLLEFLVLFLHIVLCAFPQLGQRARNGPFLGKRDCLSAYLRSTLEPALPQCDGSQESRHHSHNPIQCCP